MINPQPTTGSRQQERKFLVFWRFGRWWLVVGSWWPPLIASAQTPIKIFEPSASGLTFTSLANRLSDIANDIIPFLIGIALVVMLWGIFKYVRNAGDSEKVAEGRKVALYGTIALFLMLSFWGFVMMIKKSLFE